MKRPAPFILEPERDVSDTETLRVEHVQPVEAPVQRAAPLLAELLRASPLIGVHEGREAFGVHGAGTTVAVLDTGLRTTHLDFAGRVAAQRNFTADNGSDPEDASDRNGHGSNVTGIICAGGIHVGIAPGARVIPLKVLSNTGSGRFRAVADALQWVIDNHEVHEISAVCAALGDGGNYQSDSGFADDAVGARIRRLAQLGIACCTGGGNDYFTHGGVQGMSYPAIFRDSLSVGAVYDEDQGSFQYRSGAEAFFTGADRITPFSQRLHEKVGGACATNIFAPGVPTISSGILGDRGESVQGGGSHAVAAVTGVVLLIQSLHKRATGSLPEVSDIRRWLLRGAAFIQDDDNEQDNVLHTGLSFSRVNAFAALRACGNDLARNVLIAAESRQSLDRHFALSGPPKIGYRGE